MASGEVTGFTPNLDDVPFPPGGGSSERTGMNSVDTTREQTLLFPLDPVPLSTSSTQNNRNVFEDDDGSSKYSYLIESGTSNIYTLPADNAMGMSSRGQPIFPVYNNNG